MNILPCRSHMNAFILEQLQKYNARKLCIFAGAIAATATAIATEVDGRVSLKQEPWCIALLGSKRSACVHCSTRCQAMRPDIMFLIVLWPLWPRCQQIKPALYVRFGVRFWLLCVFEFHSDVPRWSRMYPKFSAAFFASAIVFAWCRSKISLLNLMLLPWNVVLVQLQHQAENKVSDFTAQCWRKV